MGSYNAEFDFIEDESGGGRFVSAADAGGRIHALLARKDVEAASQLCEQLGAEAAPALLKEAKAATPQVVALILEVLKKARDYETAAKVCEQANDLPRAAALFEHAEKLPEAASAYERAGQVERAASCLERAGQLEKAAALYRRANAHAPLAACLARLERYAEAAATYRQLRDLRGEVEMLRQVPANAPEHPEAVKRLAALLEHFGRAEQAAHAILSAFRVGEAARRDPELQATALRLLEALGRQADAERLKASLAKLGELPKPERVSRPVTSNDNPLEAARAVAQSHEAYSYLKAIPIFAELTLPDMRDLFRAAREAGYAPGAAIIEQGAKPVGLVVIVAGQAEVLATGEGGVRKLNQLGAGAFAGEISLVSDAPTSARVVAQEPVRALVISREAFTHFVATHPAAAVHIYRLFSQNLAERVRALSAR